MKFDKQELEKKIRNAKDLSNEDKSNLLQLLKEKKTYGLVWEDSTEEAWEKMKTSIPVLNEVDDKRILNDKDGEHYPNHAIIEADDFVYNDSFIGEDDAYRHSKWLSFMEKRLQIAKTLLSERGVIFISVDDNELAQLRLLLDEIFHGKSLDRGTLIWENRGSTKGFSKIVKNHEYILAFSNNPDAIKSLYNKNFPAALRILDSQGT